MTLKILFKNDFKNIIDMIEGVSVRFTQASPKSKNSSSSWKDYFPSNTWASLPTFPLIWKNEGLYSLLNSK